MGRHHGSKGPGQSFGLANLDRQTDTAITDIPTATGQTVMVVVAVLVMTVIFSFVSSSSSLITAVESTESAAPRFSTIEQVVAAMTAARRTEGGETTSAAMGKICTMEKRGKEKKKNPTSLHSHISAAFENSHSANERLRRFKMRTQKTHLVDAEVKWVENENEEEDE
ncbi:hypothetical protein E2C01_008160 [Portunus trituberculatus]|uniref:Uncharacterized protein n=1 Tax=Portunus trituberculatus TaxID=210409 RepID=A0A5B7D2D1_PORTR|nr:hypothetical protein [Portunus trituberculatus]